MRVPGSRFCRFSPSQNASLSRKGSPLQRICPDVTMTHSELQLRSISDPRLALHATSALPAWLFVPDGSRVLWANAPGAQAFGAASGATLAARTFGPADERRRQIAQLARRLPENGAARLERLRGFGASL